MKRLLLFSVVLLSYSSQSWGFEQSLNQRLDRAIWHEHDPKLIVAGTIDAVRTNAISTNTISIFRPPYADFSFSVQDVVLGDEKYKGQTLTIPVSSFMWPEELVPFTKGTHCILVLRTGWGEKRDGYYIYVVVPASGKELPAAKDGEGAKRILEREILAELQSEKLPERRRALLLQVAPILTKKHSQEVDPFVKSKNVWVMRAALSALIYATEEKGYIQKAAEDVQRFFTTTKRSDLINGSYAPYPYFFNHYFFLEKRSWTWGSRWSEDEANKHLRILNTMFDTGIISDEVKKILNPEPKDAPDKK